MFKTNLGTISKEVRSIAGCTCSFVVDCISTELKAGKCSVIVNNGGTHDRNLAISATLPCRRVLTDITLRNITTLTTTKSLIESLIEDSQLLVARCSYRLHLHHPLLGRDAMSPMEKRYPMCLEAFKKTTTRSA